MSITPADGPSSTVSTELVNSGAAENFIDQTLASFLNITSNPLSSPFPVQALDNWPLGSGTITHINTPPTMESIHQENIPFFITSAPAQRIMDWAPECRRICFPIPCGSTSVESPVVAFSPTTRRYTRTYRRYFPKPVPPVSILIAGGTVPSTCLQALCPRAESSTVAETKAMEEYIHEPLQQGFLCTSTSPASAGFLSVAKKYGGLCPCIDYRGLKKITTQYRYPLLLVPAAIKQLRWTRFFTKLDLGSAYDLIRIREGDDWKKAFSTMSCHYKYLMMPFGLASAPSMFQAFINEVFRDMLGCQMVVYIDDILVYSATLEDHIAHIQIVLERLLANQLYVKAEKCQFHQKDVSYLGYQISPQGVTMDVKVDAVRSWPVPTTINGLQWFLGFANFYSRFIRNFSSSPLLSPQGGSP